MTPLTDTSPDADAADLAARKRRALYRANYRGTKEMDWLLGKYAAARLPDMDAAALGQFEQFLVLPDPDLNTWILDPARLTDPAYAGLVADIRAFHDIKGALARPMTGADR